MAPLRGASFFEVVLPAILREGGSATRSVDGVIQFRVVQDVDDTSWFADLRREPPSVEAGDHEQPDATLTINEHLLLPMLTGTLDADIAFGSGQVAATGDLDTLRRFTELLLSRTSVLKTRSRGRDGH